MASVLHALGHDALPVTRTVHRGRSDGELVRLLRRLGCDWLFTLDLHRQPEVWADVYTALADEGRGRVLRLVPTRISGDGHALIAHYTSHLVHRFRDWNPALDDPSIRLIEIGRKGLKGHKGLANFGLFTGGELAQLTQQRLDAAGTRQLRADENPRLGGTQPRRGRFKAD